MYYCSAPIVGTGHTFTYSGTSIYTAMCVQAFSGLASSTPFDVQNGAATTGATSLQTGSITPTANGELLVTYIAPFNSVSVSPTIDSGFTVTDFIAGGGGNWAAAMAYFVQPTAAAINPTWSYTPSASASTEIASFKGAGGGGGGGTAHNKLIGMGGL